jgi:hypothetical protein
VGSLGRAFDAGVDGPQVLFDMGHRLRVSESTKSVADYTTRVIEELRRRACIDARYALHARAYP